MSEKTRCIKTKEVTDEEARDYLLQVSALLNEINRLEEEKDDFTKDINKQIKANEGKLERLRLILNDGIVITVHNFMDKDNHQIVWKDEAGNEVERTPFDQDDWDIYESQYGPSQKPLFNDKVPIERDIVYGENEDIPDDSSSDDHGGNEAEPEGPPVDTPEIHEYQHLDEEDNPNGIKS